MYFQLNWSAIHCLDILWSTGKATEGREQSYSPCPAVCGCKRGRGEDGEVIFVVEEGLRTNVCVLFSGCEGLRWKRKFMGWSDGKINLSVCVCEAWSVCAWWMRCAHVVSHHRYYGQTDNPSVHIGPVDSSTSSSHVHRKEYVLPIDSKNNNFNVYDMLLGFSTRQVINTVYFKWP